MTTERMPTNSLAPRFEADDLVLVVGGMSRGRYTDTRALDRSNIPGVGAFIRSLGEGARRGNARGASHRLRD